MTIKAIEDVAQPRGFNWDEKFVLYSFSIRPNHDVLIKQSGSYEARVVARNASRTIWEVGYIDLEGFISISADLRLSEALDVADKWLQKRSRRQA